MSLTVLCSFAFHKTFPLPDKLAHFFIVTFSWDANDRNMRFSFTHEEPYLDF